MRFETEVGEAAANLEDQMESRPVSGRGWTLWRAIVGVAYLGAALFNALYTLPRHDELDGYADGAWFGFLGDFMRDVFMPNGEAFMIGVIGFEIVVGFFILSREVLVDIGVVASVLWVLAILPFLAWPYLLINVVLAVVQAVLLLRRHDTTILNWIRTAPAR